MTDLSTSYQCELYPDVRWGTLVRTSKGCNSSIPLNLAEALRVLRNSQGNALGQDDLDSESCMECLRRVSHCLHYTHHAFARKAVIDIFRYQPTSFAMESTGPYTAPRLARGTIRISTTFIDYGYAHSPASGLLLTSLHCLYRRVRPQSYYRLRPMVAPHPMPAFPAPVRGQMSTIIALAVGGVNQPQ